MAANTIDILADKANKSARSFVARLADAIIELPQTKAESESILQNKTAKILNPLLDAFITAQSTAIAYGMALAFDALGLPTPLEAEDNKQILSTPLKT